MARADSTAYRYPRSASALSTVVFPAPGPPVMTKRRLAISLLKPAARRGRNAGYHSIVCPAEGYPLLQHWTRCEAPLRRSSLVVYVAERLSFGPNFTASKIKGLTVPNVCPIMQAVKSPDGGGHAHRQVESEECHREDGASRRHA